MATASQNVLVVDNDPFFLKLFSELLKRNGHEVTCANTVFECLEIIAITTPDLIFLDLVMPHLSGEDLCRVIRNHGHLQDTYIVIISAIALEHPIDIYSLGADACIAKGPIRQMENHIQEVINESLNPGKEYPLQQVRGGDRLYSRIISKELLQQIEHLKIILKNLTQGIIEIASNRIVYINNSAADMLDVTVDELLGSDISNTLPQVLLEIIKPDYQFDKDEKKLLGKNEILFNDRQIIVEHLFIRADHTTEIFILSDITERKRLESIVEAANLTENLGYVFSGIRHEIGNPVNSIKMALSVLQRNLDEYDRDTIAEFLDRSLEEISRIEYLLKALKNYSLFESPIVEKIHIASFLRDFLALIHNNFNELRIDIDTIIPDDALMVCADGRALHHVMLNLITNAADALETIEEPKLTISCYRKENMVAIKVEDNGKGIPEKDWQHLFKPFFTSKTKGTGLGLAIVKKMLAAMYGCITIESTSGLGTTATIFLPGSCNESSPEKSAHN